MRVDKDFNYDEKRKAPRVKINPLSPSASIEILDHKTGQIYKARALNISPGGTCLAIDRPLSNGRKLQMTFYDDVEQEKICLNAWVLEPLSPRSLPGFRSWRYRCQFCPSIALTTSYRAFYERLLADIHVKRLTREHPLSVNHSLDKRVRGDFIAFKVAERVEEKESAWRLVYDEYTKRRFIPPKEKPVFTSIYQLLPNTTTYVGMIGSKAALTLTSIVDTPLKLPMDKLFEHSLNKLRDNKRQLVEFALLAVKSDLFRQGSYDFRFQNRMSGLFTLFRLAIRHVLSSHAVTDLVICVPQQYERLYEYLQFQKLAGPCYHRDWSLKPMVAYSLDLTKAMNPGWARRNMRTCLWDYFFKKVLPQKAFTNGWRMNASEIDVLFKKRSDLLQSMTTDETRQLFRYFPTLKEKIITLI